MRSGCRRSVIGDVVGLFWSYALVLQRSTMKEIGKERGKERYIIFFFFCAMEKQLRIFFVFLWLFIPLALFSLLQWLCSLVL